MRVFTRVYVAGVYSYVPEGGNAPVSVFANMRRGIKASLRIWQMGFAPFCPWLDYQYSLMSNDAFAPTVHQFYGMSIAFLDACKYMVVLPENIDQSEGVQLEIDYARDKGIEIFYGVDVFEEAMRRRNLL